jgi:EmrB/QacA subfamily drug resistance transporter
MQRIHFDRSPPVSQPIPHLVSPNHKRRWGVLAVVGLAQLMVVLDATVVNIALPSAQHALHFSNTDRQWIVTAYALAFGSLLLLGGRLSDLFGRKWTFVGGLIGFAAASAVGGAAQSFDMLVGARAVQGMFGAILAPAALSLLTTTFTEASERSKAFGIFGAIAGSGASIGLLLGGVLTSWLSWRFTMFVNVFLAVGAVAAAVVVIVNERPAERPKLDLPGTLSVSAGLFALVYGFNHAQTTAWGNGVTVGFLAAGVILLAAFVAIEARVAHPLLPLRVVRDRDRGASFLAMGLAGAAMFGVFLFLTYFLQQNLHLSPIANGFAFMPLTGTILVSAMAATTQLQPRIGPRLLVSSGMGLGAVGMLLLTRLTVHSTYAGGVLPTLLILGVALGFVFAPAMNSGTLGVAPEDAGVASATVNAAQQVGGSIGTALLSTIAATAVTSALAGVAAAHPSAGALAIATVHGYTTAFAWSVGLFAVGAVVTGLLYRPGVRAADPAMEPVLAL